MASPLDREIIWTYFPDLSGATADPQFESARALGDRLLSERAATKQGLRLVAGAAFDLIRSVNGSLRYDANIREISAIPIDHDRGQVSIPDAAAAAKAANVACIIVATASHTPEFPRWRAFFPLARPLHRNGGFAEHGKLVSRAAGMFAGDIAGESWTKSQSWYVGTIDAAPDHQLHTIDGDFLDDRGDLDVHAKPKPSAAPKPTNATDGTDKASLDLAAALDALTAGQGSHEGLVYAAGLFAGQGIQITTASAMLLHAIDQRPDDKRDAGWTQLRASVGRTLRWAYAKQAETDVREGDALGIGEAAANKEEPTKDEWDTPIPPRPTEPEEPEEPEEEPEDWPEPALLPAFHGPIGEAVALIMPETEADPHALLFQTLTFFGNRIGRGPYYQVGSTGERHATNLYTLLAGATSRSRKGTSVAAARTLFVVDSDPWALACIQSGLSSGEGVVHAVRDETWGTNKKTGEHELIDAGVADKRLLVIESEFASVLTVMKRQGNTLSPVLRDAWDRGRLQTLTKTNPQRASGALVSVIGHITIDELRSEVDRIAVSNGLLNRFLFVVAKRARLLPFGGNVDQQKLEAVGRTLTEAAEAARQIGEVTLSDAARKIWGEGYGALTADHSGLLGSLIARSEAHQIRLALLYALADQSAVIEVVHLEAAQAVWTYSEASARLLFGSLVGDSVADSLLVFLRNADNAGTTRSDLHNALNRHVSAARIQLALETLLKQQRVRRSKSRAPGRSGPFTETWFYVRR